MKRIFRVGVIHKMILEQIFEGDGEMNHMGKGKNLVQTRNQQCKSPKAYAQHAQGVASYSIAEAK